MRKILLSTSAMIGLAFAIGTTNPSIADNQAPNLNISGKTYVSMYMFKTEEQDSKTKDSDSKKERKKGHGVTTGITSKVEKSKINFNAKGSTDAFGGIDYSLLIGLSGDKNQTNSARETRIKIENPSYGSLSLGNTGGPDNFKKLGASRIMGAMGGFSGNLTSIINISSDILWSTDLVGSPKGAVKLVYYTPKIEGFQFGVSFTPNTQQQGSARFKVSENINTKNPFDKNNIVGQLSYENSFNNGTTVGISLTGVVGDTQSIISKGKVINHANDTSSWAIGGQIGYGGWEIGAEYIDNGKSHVNKTHQTKGANAGKVINLGISYSFGSYKIAAGYYTGSKKLGHISKEGAALDTNLIEGNDLGKTRADIYSLTYDFKIAPGLGIFAEANYFEFKNKQSLAIWEFQNAYKNLNNAAPRGNLINKGHAILIGTKISF
jgi:outer membrane protein OmpU